MAGGKVYFTPGTMVGATGENGATGTSKDGAVGVEALVGASDV